MTFPAAWRHKSICIAVLYLVPSRKAGSEVPAPLKVCEVIPGYTIGGLYASRYILPGLEDRSEFGVLTAYTNFNDKKGFYMRRLCARGIGQAADLADGSFEWKFERGIWLKVSAQARELATIRMRPIANLPFNANFPFLCVNDSGVVHLRNNFASRIGISVSSVHIPKDSPVKEIPFGIKFLSSFWDASNIVIKEPESIPLRAGINRADNVMGTHMGKSS
ncbi:MAG TPA: hypothetical protein VGK71_09120 [Nitrospirota bacterium]|jgi:hypothetical protein